MFSFPIFLMVEKKEFNFVYLDDNELLRDEAIEAWKESFSLKKDISCNFFCFSSFEEAKKKLVDLKNSSKHYTLITDVDIKGKNILNDILQLEKEMPEMHIIVISGAQVKSELKEKGIYLFEKSLETFEKKVFNAFNEIFKSPFRPKEEQKQITDLSSYVNAAIHILPSKEKEFLRQLKEKRQLTKEIIDKAISGISLKEYLPISDQLLTAIKNADRDNLTKRDIEILHKYYESACSSEGKMPVYGKFLYFKKGAPQHKKLKPLKRIK